MVDRGERDHWHNRLVCPWRTGAMKVDYMNLDHIDPILKQVLHDIETNVMEEEPVNTSNFRPGDRGLHGTLPLRAWDLKCRDSVEGERIEDEVNERWIYDPDRPKFKVCLYHENRSGRGKHLHIQVHPNTRRRQ
jgi:hypothetical protein